jgi:FMN phosphatase YigB (HAD superfamily)
MTPAPRSTPSAPAAPIRAVVLDVDGTLYDQRRLRRAMGARLLAAAARAPRATLRDVRVLRAYRHAQEALRGGACEGGAGAAQHRWAADRARVDEATVRAAVARWMEERPLDLLAGCGFVGLEEFLRRCRGAGLRVGVFSDYPAAAKLRALGVDALVDVARSAHDPEIGRFKPDPAGLLAVAAELGVPPAEVCYVGDRPEVDAEAARRAGMRCVIISPRAARAGAADAVPDYAALTRRVCPAPAAGA